MREVSEPVTTAVAGAAGVTAISAVIGIFFGPHIGFNEVVAAFVGATAFVWVNHNKSTSPVFDVMMFCGAWFCGIYAPELAGGYLLANTDIKITQHMFPPVAGLSAFLLPHMLNGVTKNYELSPTFPFLARKALPSDQNKS